MSFPDESSLIQYVSSTKLRERFDQGKYWERSDLTHIVRHESAAPPVISGQPFGTVSQIIILQAANGHKVAVVHRYKHPDGSFTTPDPKYLDEGGIVYKAATPKK